MPNLPKIKITEKFRFRGKINDATITQRNTTLSSLYRSNINTTQEEFGRTHKPIINNHTLGINTGIKVLASPLL